jgi:hypothetical protein
MRGRYPQAPPVRVPAQLPLCVPVRWHRLSLAATLREERYSREPNRREPNRTRTDVKAAQARKKAHVKTLKEQIIGDRCGGRLGKRVRILEQQKLREPGGSKVKLFRRCLLLLLLLLLFLLPAEESHNLFHRVLLRVLVGLRLLGLTLGWSGIRGFLAEQAS